MSLESWFYKIPLRLRSIFTRSRLEQDLEQELRFHLENRVEQGIAAGLTPEAAQYQALQAMHGMEQQKEECRDRRGVGSFENLARDVRYAVRILRKSPIFTAVAVLSLALGIGANTAIFSLIDTLLIRPLPVAHPEQLRTVSLRMGGNRPQYYLTYPIFETLRAHNQIFSNVFTWANRQFQMRSGPDMIHIDGAMASGDYFAALGVNPILGRSFTPADDHPSGGKDGPVAVISDRFWLRQFQRNPSAVGSAITLDRVRFTIIGVMPPEFFGAEVAARPDVWVPLTLAGTADDPECMASRSCWWLVMMGRLKPGVSDAEASAALEVTSPQLLHDTVPTGWGAAQQKNYLRWRFLTSPGAQGWTFLRTEFSNPLAVLMILVGLVLLIACANLANLLLARASARQREIAVRLSIGAGRARIIRQLLTESTLLSLLGGAAGSLFAVWLTRVLVAFLESKRQFGPNSFIKFDLQPDWRVVLFTLAVALAAGLLFGFAPALRATRIGISASLKESASNLRAGDARIGFGRLILPLQAALSVVLVAASGVFAGSLFHLLTLNPGFNSKDVLLISVDTDRREEKGTALINLYGRLLEKLNGAPGIKAASLIWFTPLTGAQWDESPTIPGRTDLTEQDRDTYINPIGPRFFEVMEIPMLAGRPFSEADSAASEKVGVINDMAARRFFPKVNPVGAQIILDKTPIRIVGIVGNIKYTSLREPYPLELYIPYTQKADNTPSYTFLLKTGLSAAVIYPEFRAALREIAPDTPIGFVKPMQLLRDESISTERLMASLSMFFGVLALILTSVGLYGILAYTVTRRTGEIGIRMALGATGHDVIWLVLRDIMGLVVAGIAVGIVSALASSKLIAGLLYGIEPNDPINLVTAVLLLLLVATAAAFFPALRASRLNPTISLRQE